MNKVKQKEKRTFLDLFFPSIETYSVAVVDDDEYFNKMLVHSLKDFSSNLKILHHAKIKLYPFFSAQSFIRSFRNREFEGTKSIFFIDYFLENNKNAKDILKVINLEDEHRMVILSEKKNYATASETREMGAKDFIRKDQFTNFMCTTLLEEFVREGTARY